MSGGFLHRFVVQSDPTAHFTTLAANVRDEESLQIASDNETSHDLIFGNVSPGQRSFIIDSIQIKVSQDSNTATLDQEMDLIFYHSSDFDNATLTTDSFLGHLTVASGAAEWVPGATAGVHYWEDHDISLFYYDSDTAVEQPPASVVLPARLHLQIHPITGGGLLAADVVVVQVCLIEPQM